ncbi:DUF6438 domain-containing protein [Mucilaginibacter ginsenosidivorax]|uniref:DUF6438 domain-containing protein n=1 Tax=Mucilaginibacter ginsenosidivorax TaxID=862126 RepID=A0A5B8W5Q0_9SPHI|nr:DUF6438 domain-containing protein [Mucilaginibacter ginsenosidivorax]QEC78232.1 hypothetical protein FSB76_20650 [Mucilaginibacter ginsenosidivorax]
MFFTILFFLAACNKQSGRNNEITKIEIATGGCFGPCQSTVVSIDSSLSYKYWGGGLSFILPSDTGKKEKLLGYYSAKISRAFWDTLNMKLEHISYKHLDTIYQHSVDDQSLEVFIHYGNKVKRIKAQSASLPDGVGEVLYYIIRSYKIVKPKPTRDTFRFESVQRPFPAPDVRGIRFPPPTKMETGE